MFELDRAIAGLFIGTLVGMTGMGGACLMIPIMLFFLKIEPLIAIGTDLAYSSITKVFGAYSHYKKNNVDLRVAFYLAIGSLPTSLLGVGLISFLKENYHAFLDIWITRALGLTLVSVSIALIFRTIRGVCPMEECQELGGNRRKFCDLSHPKKIFTVILGALTGLLVGLTSLGSGVIIATFLICFYPLSSHKIVGTDILHAAFLALVAGIAHYQIGNVDLLLMANLLMGSIPGVIIGSHLNLRLPQKQIRYIIAIVLGGSGILVLY